MAKHQYSRTFKQYTLLCSDPDHVIYNLLDEISRRTSIGHSFNVVIGPDTCNEITAFIDGDGCDKIHYIGVREVEQTYVYDDKELIRNHISNLVKEEPYNDKPIRRYMVNMGAEHEQGQS